MLSGCGTSATSRYGSNSLANPSPLGTAICDLAKHPAESAELHVVQVKASPSGSVEVRVRDGKAPMVLLLSSEQPTNWKLEALTGAQVQRVILIGDRSSVLGLTSTTRLSHCGKSDGFAPFRVETVDRVADALVLSIANLERHSIAAATGYEVRSRKYPNLEPDNPYDRCRIDFDYAGDNITRRDVSTAETCRTLCDEYGVANSWQGRTVCIFDGERLKAYAPVKSVKAYSCRLLAPSGRNVRSYPAKTEADCRETVCYVGAYLWRDAKDQWGSQCRYRGRTIESHGMRSVATYRP